MHCLADAWACDMLCVAERATACAGCKTSKTAEGDSVRALLQAPQVGRQAAADLAAAAVAALPLGLALVVATPHHLETVTNWLAS